MRQRTSQARLLGELQVIGMGREGRLGGEAPCADATVGGSEQSVPINNVRELIAFAKAQPGKLRFGSSGIGAASHLSGELFKAQAHVDLQHVPYKGTGQALTDLLGGQIELMFAPTQTVIPQLQSGRLKAIAVTGTKPLEALPVTGSTTTI